MIWRTSGIPGATTRSLKCSVNFSFGDYFKKDAVQFGWDYLTKTLGLPADQLWVTIFQDDDEAFALWENSVGVPAARIVRLGYKTISGKWGRPGLRALF